MVKWFLILSFVLCILAQVNGFNDRKFRSIYDFKNHVQQQDFSFKNDILEDINNLITKLKQDALRRRFCPWKICAPLKMIQNQSKEKQKKARKILIQLQKHYI